MIYKKMRLKTARSARVDRGVMRLQFNLAILEIIGGVEQWFA